jgi:hypothetical protein
MPSNELSKHPICLLAEQVQSGHLSLAQAWEQVAAEKVLAQVDEATLCKLNQRA